MSDLNIKERYYQDLFDVIGKNGLNLLLTQCGEMKQIISKESIEKRVINRRKNKDNHKNIQGENSSSNILTTEQILKIYTLIKQFKSNEEIIIELSLNIDITGISQIRNGKNWVHIWKKENMIIIPSLKRQLSTSKTAIEKFKVLEDIEKGICTKDLKIKHNLQYTDIEKIKNKILWKPVWRLYEQFYKPLKIKND